MKARKKPVEIEFLTFEEIWESNTHDNIELHHEPTKHLIIHTLEGDMLMTEKDYLIIGVRGEMYPCKIDIFNETYDIIE